MASVKSRIKKRIKSLLRAWLAPKIREFDFQRGLQILNVPNDKPILVHSSLSACGFVPGGPQTLIDAIQGYLGPEGTIVLPTHSWNLVNRGLRTFDARKTPSCVGAVTEWFRRQPGVIRSLHPTHSVTARGPLANQITYDHQESKSPCGPGSPYDRLLEMDATILFFGAPLESNTSYHCCEGLTGLSYLLQPEKTEFELIDMNDVRTHQEIWLHQAAIPRNLNPLNRELKQLSILKSEPLGLSLIQSICGRKFRDFLCEKLARDPHYLLA